MAGIRVEHDGAPLHGTVRLDGGRHAFAHSLACAALCDRGRLTEVPDHVDARALRAALALAFSHVRYDRAARELTFSGPVRRDRVVVSRGLAERSRNLFCLLPALLTRAAEVVVEGAPQGCWTGARPADRHLAVLARFGVRTRFAGTTTVLSWPRRVPARVVFERPTAAGTVLALAAAAATPGRSTVLGASVEPSCGEQLACLRAMGGRVEGEPPRVEIGGADGYARVGWAIAPDRVHAVTYLTAGLLTRGEVTVTGSGPLRIPRFVAFLRDAGARVTERSHSLTAGFPASGTLRPARVAAGPEPAFSGDWVGFASLLLAMRASGGSVVGGEVPARRFDYAGNLAPLGLDGVRLRTEERHGRPLVLADIRPNSKASLRGGDLGGCADIRGAAALLLAALTAEGPCVLRDDFPLRRGYTDLPRGLTALGVKWIGDAP
ncbi:hypothetical protein M1P56_13880 [Streptomyces sp. HU2014]|uniref:hypothetical protein n=1 Tax=Streptomyces sp. HU2014 TaxID=2939414 RepID=UPI00200EF6FB|nr:hypothetical protein [Streptomyces sp. HU2014]UQI45360.1 hypothetical protein M1P56_13880 [Streptomyces sp. HU2014]